MKTFLTLASLIIALFFFQDSTHGNYQEKIKLNDIQVIGSHNSYKIRIEKPLFDFLVQKDSALNTLGYEHIPLSEQLDLGLRGLELDVYNDPEGGYYSDPKGLEIIKSLGAVPEPFDVEQKLKIPGLKIFHVQEIDFRSHQLVFKDALKELKKWSNSNKGHSPIVITINAKDGEIPQTRKPLPFTSEALKSIDTEILDVFKKEDLITPDLVRGDFKTLEEAVLKKGWPVLSAVKNRFLFVLDEGDKKTNAYLSNFPNLKGAVLFVNTEEGKPTSAFRIINDPIKEFDKIKKLVALGYMVRTRADADTKEARNSDYSRFQKAKLSGAQVITTDYYLPSKFFKSDFRISFENGVYERLKINKDKKD